jgi:deazaflavin-dependent oxidoreductase (nitroreductase family)
VLYFITDGPTWVVVGSNAGGDRDPTWWTNLAANPDAEIQVGSVRHRVHARETTGDERTRLWTRLVTANPDYAEYAAWASRHIPVVVLEPTAAAAPDTPT